MASIIRESRESRESGGSDSRDSRIMGQVARCPNSLSSLWAAQLARLQSDLATSRALLDESLALARAHGDRFGTAVALYELFTVKFYAGDFEGTEALASEALGLFRELGDDRGASLALGQLGNIASERGDYEVALAHYAESLLAFREVGSDRYMAEVFESIASVETIRGNASRAACLIGAAARAREAGGLPLSETDRVQVDADLEAARRALGTDGLDRALAHGRAMTVDDAIAYATGSGERV
jgi:tetratricopeptide (TPR) repeat protein